MKKLLKKLCASALALTTAVSVSVFAASASDVEVTEDSISNEFIRVVADEDRFCMYTAEGKLLLFEGSPGTSKCIYAVDDQSDTIGDYGTFSIDASTKSMTSYSMVNDVKLTRVLTIVPNSVTGDDDTLEVKVVAENTGAESHNVGVRIMLDTMLGQNDDAPFRVGGVGEVKNRVQFDGSDVPTVYQAFDDLVNPTVVSTGTFLSGSGRPDSVQYNNFWTVNNDSLYPDIKEGESIGDSTVNAIWSQRTLAPGSSFTCRAYYGLGRVDVNSESNLVLGASQVEKSFTINEDGTGYNPVTILSYLQNNGFSDLTNAKTSITLPAGVTLESGDTEVGYSSIAVGEIQQNTWKLVAQPSGVERSVTVTINAESTETGKVTPVVYTYIIPAIDNAPVIEETTVEETTVEETTVEGTTVEETTVEETTAEQTTVAPTTKDSSTGSEPNSTSPSNNTNGAVQTGGAIPALAILIVLISACSALYFFYIKKKS